MADWFEAWLKFMLGFCFVIGGFGIAFCIYKIAQTDLLLASLFSFMIVSPAFFYLGEVIHRNLKRGRRR